MLPRRLPGEGEKCAKTWQYEKVEGGTSFSAWKTGDCFWCETHHVGQSKPCCAIMTNGAIPCSVDHGHYPLKWLGYLPLVRETGQAVVVVVQGYSLEQVEALPLGVELTVKRDKGRNKPVQLVKTIQARSFKGFESRRVVPAEFESWLLRFWSEPSLLSFFSARSGSTIAGCAESDPPAPAATHTTRLRLTSHDPSDPERLGHVLDRHNSNGHK